jgi:hypothetical protein
VFLLTEGFSPLKVAQLSLWTECPPGRRQPC